MMAVSQVFSKPIFSFIDKQSFSFLSVNSLQSVGLLGQLKIATLRLNWHIFNKCEKEWYLTDWCSLVAERICLCVCVFSSVLIAKVLFYFLWFKVFTLIDFLFDYTFSFFL